MASLSFWVGVGVRVLILVKHKALKLGEAGLTTKVMVNLYI